MHQFNIFLVLFFGNVDVEFAKHCNIVLENLPANYPLFIKDANEIYPKRDSKDSEAYLTFEENENFYVGCSTANKAKNSLKFSKEAESLVECLASGDIAYGKKKFTLKDFECKFPNKETVEITDENKCGKTLLTVNIIFETSTKMPALISACHNPDKDETVMTFHIIHGEFLNGAEISNKRPPFKEGSKELFSKIQANKAYTQKSQLGFVSEIVGSKELGKRYIDSSKSFYFARGHLSPDGDFIYAREQNATYYFFNVIPQWQSINNGNWKALESTTRKLAIERATNTNVYTGSFKVLELNDVNNNLVEIYLAKDKEKNLRLPVPRLTWKVLHVPDEKKAIAIIMINNPHQDETKNDDIICPNICDKLKWINWDRKNFKKGYTYCCDLNSFRKVVTIIPDFGSVGILE